MAKTKMEKPAKTMMLEDSTGTYRYVFFSMGVERSNIDSTIEYYVPMIRYCERLHGGSTYVEYRVSVERGNETFKELLAKGYKIVGEGSFA